MGKLKTLALAMALAILTCGPSMADGFPISVGQRASAFALCTGAYTAVAEHSAMFDSEATELAAKRRADFAQLLDAVHPHALAYGLRKVDITATRVQARADMRTLLSAAKFSQEHERAVPAQAAIEARLAHCDRLLLGV